MDHVLNPCVVGIARRRDTVLPAHIIKQLFLIPRMIIERRIRKDKISLQSRMQVVCKGICLIGAKVGIYTAYSHIHLCHLPGVGVCLLSVNGDCATFAGMRLNEFCALHEHTAGTAAAVIYTAVIKGTQDGNERLNHAGRCIEFTTANAFFFRELCNAVFVCTTEEVFTLFGIAHINVVREDVYDIAQNPLVEVGAGVVLRKNIFQRLVLGFDSSHGVINDRADLRRVSSCGNGAPPCFLRHEENILHRISVAVILEAVAFIHEFLISFIKGCGYVAQKDKPDDYLSVFRCRYMSPQNASCIPQLFFKAYVGIRFVSHLN